jgi:hypothetical protein
MKQRERALLTVNFLGEQEVDKIDSTFPFFNDE